MGTGEIAAGYLRVSRARDDMHAPQIYEDQIRRWASAYGHTVARIYADIDYSGRKGTRTRPEFTQMLADAETSVGGLPQFSMLIVPKLSRFGRSMKDNLEAYDRLEAAGVTMVFLDLGGDASTAGGKLMRNVLTSLAEYESDLIGERWKDTHQYLARAGRYNGSAIYGYDYDKTTKQLTINEPEAVIVRELFDRFAAGDALYKLATDLNGRGIVGKRGARQGWTPTSVANMLDNPTYAARRQIGRYKNAPGEVLPGAWEPIVTDDAFDHVQRLRAATKATAPAARRRGKGKTMLAGLVYCEHGHPMWRAARGGARQTRYECSQARGRKRGDCSARTVVAAALEERLIAEVLDKIEAPATKRALSAPKSLIAPTAADPRSAPELDARAREIEAEMKNLVALATSTTTAGPLAQRAFQEREAELEGELAEIDKARATLAAAEARARAGLDKLRATIGRVREVWDALTPEERRELLRLVVKRVDIVDPKAPTLTITWADWLS